MVLFGRPEFPTIGRHLECPHRPLGDVTDQVTVTVDKIPKLTAVGFKDGMGVEPKLLVGKFICWDQEHPVHLALSAHDSAG